MYGPTLMIDEGDSFLDDKKTLLGILKDGHRKGGNVIRTAFAARDASIMCSIALQYGVPAEVLRHAIGRNSDGSAAGPLGKLLDLIAKEAAK